ncbi:MAG TPA: rhamnogalacturonan acetylesterase [Hanamia sp.]|nr:rhamnogalacturonan acetylesterase [Hanamia sp.]
MIKAALKKGLFICLLGLVSFTLPIKKHTTIWMIGDSTMCQYDSSRFPLTGWGMPFAQYFDSSVTIKNEARGGRSTRTFIAENRWQPIVNDLSDGDYVFIQFGHNDEAKNYPDRYTTPEDYRNNLIKFVRESRDKKAVPVLITPVSRRKFDASGNAVETHEVYSKIVREVAAQMNVPLIDLDEMSLKLFQQFGEKNSALLFMQLAPGENPDYPSGIHDNTHFNAYGARHIAELVLQGINNLHLELTDRIFKKS